MLALQITAHNFRLGFLHPESVWLDAARFTRSVREADVVMTSPTIDSTNHTRFTLAEINGIGAIQHIWVLQPVTRKLLTSRPLRIQPEGRSLTEDPNAYPSI
jgi:hypothetical protein